jgi:23S rRNA (uracil1939-C5)-methyltransferase
VVFVPYGSPGDTLEVELVEVRKNFARAHLVRVVEASPVRQPPPCPYHFPAKPLYCGGCSWQHMNYDFQLDAKRQLVHETLERIGKLSDIEVRDTLGMKEPWRYRNKVQQPVGWDGQQVISGFYAPNSHAIVPIEDCLVQPELSVAIINRTRRLLEQYHLRVYDEQRQSGWIRHLLIRTAQGKAMGVLVTRTDDFPHAAEIIESLSRDFPALAGIHQNVNSGKTNVILGRQWIKRWGEDSLEERLGTLRFRLSPGSFFQVNTLQTEVLYEQVRRMAGTGHLLVDLYSGVGGIALYLARGFQQVIGVEEVRSAACDAQENARLNGIQNAKFITSPAETFLIKNPVHGIPPRDTVVVLDPPRAGCDPRVLNSVLRLSPGKIVYVSCDPGTLARDLALLAQSGYRAREVQPVDLFPHTPHIETVVLLTR